VKPLPRARLPALALMCVLAVTGRVASTTAATPFAPVLPGYTLQFPRDYGSHPQFRIEWWYLTGWLTTAQQETLGFQITFFRTRTSLDDANPSAFAPHELLIAHCALSDPKHARFWHDQRVRRAGLGLAEAQPDDTRVWIDDWRLERQQGDYRAQLAAQDFALSLRMTPTQPPLPNGTAGFSRKGPEPLAASYYYSEPHLRVGGQITRAGSSEPVSGEAWLDHEWSSNYLDSRAAGWDWLGLNLADGGALMAFRIRDRRGGALWSAGTLREPSGTVRTLEPGEVAFSVRGEWRSPHTQTSYPTRMSVRAGIRQFELEPLLDDQENDTRLSSGAIYWEGAVTALENQRPVGRGYLELTGYDRPLSLP
jgi:predicted secreted hydrolase